MARFFKLHLTLILLVLIGGTQSIQAHWVPNGVGICADTHDQLSPQIVSDGAGGAIIAWRDFRGGTDAVLTDTDIYAQRVDASGNALWAENGVAICTAANEQTLIRLVPDGMGGVIITWYDSRNSNSGAEADIYAQRVDASGNTLWTENGVAVCTAAGNQTFPQLICDGVGGAIITWFDGRWAEDDIYAQRIDTNGNPLWTTNGVAICTAVNYQEYPQLVSDGEDGAIIMWEDHRRSHNSYDTYAQRINANGNPLWTANGVVICTAANSRTFPQFVSDGAGGAIIAWFDYRSEADADVYAQRIDGRGNPLWAANGMAICTAVYNQTLPKLISNGADGAIITWEDYRSGYADMYGQRVELSGNALWLVNGVAICTAIGAQHNSQLVSDEAGGVIIMWEDDRSGNCDIYAQRVDAGSNVLWTANGAAVCTTVAYIGSPSIVSDYAGGAIFAWEDYRNGRPDIYAQRIRADGNAPIATLLQNYAASFSDRGIALTWRLSAVDKSAAFSVERSTASNGSFIELPSSTLTRDDLSFSFIDRDWEPNASYWYRVEYSTGNERKVLFESGPVATPAVPLTLYQNSPNPFNPSTEIRYYLPEKCSVALNVYDVTGELVTRLTEGYQNQGSHTVSWNARDRNGRQVSSGVYFYRLKAGKTEISKKMVLAR